MNTGVRAGAWTVRELVPLSSDGPMVLEISDGTSSIATINRPVDLMVALAKFCGVRNFETTADD